MMAVAAPSAQVLPSLLTSRPQALASWDSEAPKPVFLPAPSPVCLATEPMRKLPEPSPMYISMSSKLADTSAALQPELEHFSREVEVSTCPSNESGRSKSLFESDCEDEPAVLIPGSHGATNAATSSGAATATAPAGLPAVMPPVAVECTPPLEQYYGECPVNACMVDATGSMGGYYQDYQDLDEGESSTTYSPGAYFQNDEEEAAFFPAGMWNGFGAAMLGDEATSGLCESPPSVLKLADLLDEAGPECSLLGPGELPSEGSAGHSVGRCKPCAFYHTVGCANGLNCEFCHLCEAGERRRRRKEKRQAQRAVHKLRRAARAA